MSEPEHPTAAAAWPEVKALFDRAIEVPHAQRAAFVRASGAGAAVQREVLSLLAHSSQADAPHAAFMAVPAAAELLRGEGTGSRDGQRLGAWEIVGLIGRGGMGDVFEARRADGAFEGRVAIKVLRRGMDSDAVLQRFALEQQALARLDHPHIARLIDAGRTGDGLPYFVMERVQGESIDRACAALPLETRLQLFLQLADAVAHAHRNLLVHRDLKPTNVLVTPEGVVKLLDFGIAKLIDPLEQADAGLTAEGVRPYTPHYASPEQVRGEPVTTATDVYSLGVLLYVMLTGQRPYGRDARSAAEAARSVLEEEPTRPSGLAAAGGADTASPVPARRLRGDLDNILFKALHKRIDARYASVDSLASDVRAHLAGFPVSARGRPLAYVAAKFVARNRLATAASALGLCALVGALAGMAWQAQRTELARRDAERRFADVRRLANQLVFKYHDQIAQLPGAVKVREGLLGDAIEYLDGLRADALADPRLARELAETYLRIAALQGDSFALSMERLDQASHSLDKAASLLPLYIDRPDVEVAALNNASEVWVARATLDARRGDLTRSMQALQQARAVLERARARQPDDVQVISHLATLNGRIALLMGSHVTQASLGRIDEAGRYWAEAMPLFERLVEREPAVAEWVHQLAWASTGRSSWHMLAGEYEQSLQWAERSVALRDNAARMAPSSAHFRYQAATARMSLGSSYTATGQYERALALQDEAMQVMRAAIESDPSNKAARRDLVVSGVVRGRVLLLAGQVAAARDVLERTLVELTPMVTPGDFYLARWQADNYLWLARAWRADDPRRAEAWADDALALMEAAAPDRDNANRRWMQAQAMGEQAAALAARGLKAQAAQRAQLALQRWMEGAGPPPFYSEWVTRDRLLAQAVP